MRDYGVEGQLGLEATPDAYVAALVAVFREVRRVLRADGTCWVNLGDSYAASSTYNTTNTLHTENGWKQDAERRPNIRAGDGLKPKDLVGIPWRVAFSLQADGWYLRSDIIWSKPNPMPESVTDRPTKSHEYVFLLSKSPRYFFDAEAVRETYRDGDLRPPHGPGQSSVGGRAASGTRKRTAKAGTRHFEDARANDPDASGDVSAPGIPRAGVDDPEYQKEPGSVGTLWVGNGAGPEVRGADGRRATRVVAANGSIQHRNGERWPNPTGRNVRSVWEIATQPYPEAHFATFPEALARRCILAGCPEWVCGTCGKARERIVEKTTTPTQNVHNGNWDASSGYGKSGCGHGAYAPGVVLDPFGGSGTTALVARKHGRRSILIELSPEYAAMAAQRLQQLSLLAEVGA